MESHIKISLDKYSKIVLSVIAVCLVLIAANMYFSPTKLNAYETVQDVNLKSINGSSIYGSEIPIDLKKVSSNEDIGVDVRSVRGRSIFGDKIPVDVQAVGGQFIVGGYMPVSTR